VVPETYITGFGGSVASRAGVRFAERLSAVTGARVVAATTYRTAGRDGRPWRRARALLESLGDGGVDRAAVPARSPGEGLRRLIESLGASVLVVGADRRAGAPGSLAPGVAAELLRRPPCTVVVVPDPYAHPAVRTVTVAYDGRPSSQPVLWWAAELAIGLRAGLVAYGARSDTEAAVAQAA
jgi:nucleotide-binding universal stress UspA family protein